MQASEPENGRKRPPGSLWDVDIFEKKDCCMEVSGEERLLGACERCRLSDEGIEDPYL